MTTAAPSSDWGNKAHLIQQVNKLWQSGTLLQEAVQPGDLFPKRLIFKTPTGRSLTDQLESVLRWLEQTRRLSGFRVEYKTIRHRVLGEQRLPSEVWLDRLDQAVDLIDQADSLMTFKEQYQLTQQRLPALLPWLYQQPIKALSYAEQWPRLLNFVQWRLDHPSPAIYLRQVSLPGIDSKFIEQHRSVLAVLLDQVLPPEQIRTPFTGIRQFAHRYGFRDKPDYIRFRWLDTDLALQPSVDGDMRLTAADFNRVGQQPGFSSQIRRVFITENEINFLTFPAQPHAMLIFGAGYGFSALDQISWLNELDIVYWGDIDSHGFAILNQLRSHLPRVKSMLMDHQTLMDHRAFWGKESKPEHKALPCLNNHEQQLYQDLIQHRYQKALRLEQEQIDFHYLIRALNQVN